MGRQNWGPGSWGPSASPKRRLALPMLIIQERVLLCLALRALFEICWCDTFDLVMQSNNLLGCCFPNPLGWVAMDFELVELPGIIFDPADWVEMLKMDAVIDSLVVY